MIDVDGQQLGVMPKIQALTLAREKGYDLILVASDDKSPVCKIADFGKMRYEMIKQEKEARKKQKSGTLKELKLSTKIGDHDYKVVLKKSIEFLAKGHRVKLTVQYKRREITHQEIGQKLMQRFLSEVAVNGTVENPPKLEGKMYWVMLVPK